MGKPKPNAFAFYMQERRKQFEKEGKNYTMSQMPALVHNDWKNMPADQKKKYEDMCKNAKGANRLTCDGIPLELTEMDRLRKIEHDKAMKNDIENYLSNLMQSQQILKEYFYIININEYCYYATKECYIPAEIGICCFNLSRGVINDYHVILNPTQLPLGYKGTATKFSEETHRLPVPPDSIGETNYELVLNDIIKFLSTDPSKGEQISVMFALGDENRNDNKNYTKVTSVMADLAVKYGLSENKFKIYPLTYLFFYFNKLIGETNSYPSTSLILNEIEKDIYAYENAIACEPHKNNEAINWCARSKSIRYAYSFLEHFCPYYGVQLKPGCHVPEKAKIKNSDVDSETASNRSFNTRSQSIKSEVSSLANYSFADDAEDEDDVSAIPSTYASDVDSDY